MPDTSVIVAAICDWHDRYEHARNELERRLDAGERMILAAPTLVESFAVLTRLPPAYRVSAREATVLIETSFLSGSEIVALSGDDYAQLVRAAPDDGIAGGRVYDRIIAACAVRAGVATLLTFNVRDFTRLPLGPVAVVVPE
jgi:predicted nucleic acid-binding protein